MPMRSERFRLNTPTLAILNQDGKDLPLTVPAGAIVKLVNGPLNGNRFVDIEWDGKTITMFAADIRERCVRLEDV